MTAGRRPPDLTQLERAKAELAESEARFRLLAQVAPVGIVQMDAGGHCTYANDRFCALTGTTAARALGVELPSAITNARHARSTRSQRLSRSIAK